MVQLVPRGPRGGKMGGLGDVSNGVWSSFIIFLVIIKKTISTMILYIFE